MYNVQFRLRRRRSKDFEIEFSASLIIDLIAAISSKTAAKLLIAALHFAGGTGFLGSILIEKLSRSCDISTIYLLIRSKKDTSVSDRLDEIFQSSVSE